jgi:chlorobactene glucosyltransferase
MSAWAVVIYLAIVLLVWLYRARQTWIISNAMPVIENPETDQKALSGLPFVSVIIPAKNEEKNIRACIESLLDQDYPDYEIIVINDNSSDKTEALCRSMGAQKLKRNDIRYADNRLTYLNAPPCPNGWTGKNHAIAQAIPFARGEWFLFTDADTRHEPSGISASVRHATKHKILLLTLLPRCLSYSFFEDMIQPTAMGFMGLWFPIHKVNDPDQSVFFANGQYLMMHRTLYEKLGGHSAVREAFLEDFALMKKAKTVRAKIECALGIFVYGTRMYNALRSLWRGWRRIYRHAFESNPLELLLKSASVFMFSVTPFVAFGVGVIFQETTAVQLSFITALFGLLLVTMTGTAWKAYDTIKAKKIHGWTHPVAAVFLSFILLNAAWMAATGKQTDWR